MQLFTELYTRQLQRWPKQGRHILGQFDDESIVVYQAYNPAIAHFAVSHGTFGGEFSFNRMSWIKPNFLWMMYRSGWATKTGQTAVLAIWIKRTGFDQLLQEAVHSTFLPEQYNSEAAWKDALRGSSVRLQWDPDHDPSGAKVERRAIQLGLRGDILTQYAKDWILQIEDVSPLAHEQYQHVVTRSFDQLILPREDVYPIESAELATKLGMEQSTTG